MNLSGIRAGGLFGVAVLAMMLQAAAIAASNKSYSQHIQTGSGRVVPWIDEDLDADTGQWIARNILIAQHGLPKNRGRYYNHSGFADLVISGLIGVRPEPGNSMTLHPLVPPRAWDYFALDGVPYHGHILTIFYDRDGTRYRRGAGLSVLCDGQTIAHTDQLQTIHVELPLANCRFPVSRVSKEPR
jgi:hypothetical protein